MRTTLYDDSVAMIDIVKSIATNVYTDINNSVYDNETKELTVTATIVGSSAAFQNADLIYVAYDAAGVIVDVYDVAAASKHVNAAAGRGYPYGKLDLSDVDEGEVVTIKAYLWTSLSGMTPISNVGQGTYTVPVTVVE